MRQPAAPPQPVHSDSSFPAIGAPIEVRRHPKARRLTLRVSRTRRAVIVTLPVQCDLDEAAHSSIATSIGCASGSAACRIRCTSPTAWSCRCAPSRTACPSTGPPPAGVWSRRTPSGRGGRAARLRPRRARAAAAQGLALGGGPPRPRCARVVARRAARPTPQAHRRPRSDEPLGLVLDDGRALLLLASRARAAPGARLRGRARGRSPRRDEPRAAILGARAQHGAVHGRVPSLAAGLRRGPASLRSRARDG